MFILASHRFYRYNILFYYLVIAKLVAFSNFLFMALSAIFFLQMMFYFKLLVLAKKKITNNVFFQAMMLEKILTLISNI